MVLSWNVIYHGTLGDVGRRLAEIWPVLESGALYQGTMRPTRNINTEEAGPSPLKPFDTGSISAAARDMGMSYKRAWLLLHSINQAFTERVVRAAPGGAGGGGATLTPFGAEVLERYNRILDHLFWPNFSQLRKNHDWVLISERADGSQL